MTTLLQLTNVSKAYDAFALQHISMHVPAGSIVGFIGENGAGKTTTIKAIIGAVQPDAGEITLFGHPVDAAAKQQIGVVMEGSFFHEDFTATQIERVLRGVYTNWQSAHYHAYLQKFNVPTNQKVKTFSKGMRMKLSLAIALSHEAKLLILDEPTSGLDPIVRNELLDELQLFIEDETRAVLMSSHITSDLEKIADYITFIHNGSILFTEEKDTLLYEYGILKCGASEFGTLDVDDLVSYRKGEFHVEALVRNKRDMQKKYPHFLIERATLDDLMLFHIRGTKQ